MAEQKPAHSRVATKSKPTAAPAPERREPITRTSERGAWWCPFCDTSHESKVRHCRCTARREGDMAVKA